MIKLLPYDAIRLYLRTESPDAELKPFVDMAIAAIESSLGNTILYYGNETPKPIAQAVLMVLGALYNSDAVANSLTNANGLLEPWKASEAA